MNKKVIKRLQMFFFGLTFIILIFFTTFQICGKFVQSTILDLISFSLFSFLFFLNLNYISLRTRILLKTKSNVILVQSILFLLLISYIFFYIYLIQNKLSIICIIVIQILIFIDIFINKKKFLIISYNYERILNFSAFFIIGIFYILAARLFEPLNDIHLESIAGYRWMSLPTDNQIPRIFADKLYNNFDPRDFEVGVGWTSSDRPPLCTSFILLFRPFFEFLNIPTKTSSYSTTIGFQLIWIPVLLNILHILKINRVYSFIILLSFTFNGFIFHNSIYTWPKLGAGALLLYAFFIYHKNGLLKTHNTIIMSILTALAWLSHGGVSISIIPILLIVICRPKFFKIKQFIIAGAIVASLCLPWTAYQKLYDPPGDRLLKWHIGGQPEAINKSLSDTIYESYSSTSIEEWIENRKSNLLLLFGNSFSYLSIINSSSSQRIGNDFYFFFRSHEITIILSCLLLIYLILKRGFTSTMQSIHQGRLFLNLLFLSLTFWIFLLFMPNSTVIHSGSYLNNLVLMMILHIFLYKFSKPLLILNTIIYFFYFSVTYLPEYNSNFGNINYFSLFNLISLFVVSFFAGIRLILNKPVAKQKLG
jgi:hypothetical protein